MPKYNNIKIVSDACCRVPARQGALFPAARGKSACAFLMLDEQENIIAQRARYLGECTPPEAEYAGLIFALDSAVEYGRNNVEVWMDSELVIRQMNGDYCIRSPQIKIWFDEVKRMERRFLGAIHYFHHDRGTFWAREADKLANGEYSRLHSG